MIGDPVFTADSLARVPLDEIAQVLNACYYAQLENEFGVDERVAERCLAIYRHLRTFKPKARVETHLKKYGTCKCGARKQVYAMRCVVCWRRECAMKRKRKIKRRAA